MNGRFSLRAALRDGIRTAPLTSAYLLVLVVTTWVLQTSSPRIANRLLLEQSTNLHHLAHDPIRVLVGSAFWLGAGWELLLWAPLFALVLAPVERRLGSGRTTLVFAAGHIGATLFTAAGLWVALHVDVVEKSVINARDVGPSYGFFAVAALMTAFVDPRLRRPYAAGLVVLVVALLAVSQSFTDAGHLLATGLGFACLPLAGRARATMRPVGASLLQLVQRRRHTTASA
ncbi:MAG TPA: rhomboid-like protein [Gaiellaceae bacterium]